MPFSCCETGLCASGIVYIVRFYAGTLSQSILDALDLDITVLRLQSTQSKYRRLATPRLRIVQYTQFGTSKKEFRKCLIKYKYREGRYYEIG